MKLEPYVWVLDPSHPDGQPGCYTLRCDRCGKTAAMHDDVPVGEFREFTAAFVERHRACANTRRNGHK